MSQRIPFFLLSVRFNVSQLESISVLFKEMNTCYNDNDGISDDVWAQLDKLYENFQSNRNDAMQLLKDMPNKRVQVVHNNDGIDQREVMVADLNLLNIVKDEYLLPSRNILTACHYNQPPAQGNFNIATTLSYQDPNINRSINNNNSQSSNIDYSNLQEPK